MLTLVTLVVLAAQEPAAPQPAAGLAQGPFVGHCDPDTIHLWARARAPGRYTLHLRRTDRSELPGVEADASTGRDLVLHWRITGLRSVRGALGWRLVHANATIAEVGFPYLQPARTDDAPRATIAFGSCAEERKVADQPVWAAIQRAHPDALVLLGDTPYIDSTSLSVQRRRYAEFHAFAPVRQCLTVVSTYATWDDHDYAQNDWFGDVDGREHSRQAFVENHALGSYGEGAQGIYTKFRRGPVEVYVLDTRWFADTEPCPFDATRRSLLGRPQLGWLQRNLLESTAPFKVLACGMVWNGAVRPNKRDCWGNWLHERDGLLRWLGERGIAGIVLVSGDLHVTRLIRHPTRALCGYDVPECITSPLAQDVIPANAGRIDGVLFDAAIPATFLLLVAEVLDTGPRLLARFCGGKGQDLHVQEFPLAELSPPARK
jgi:alkaline phosphatase D